MIIDCPACHSRFLIPDSALGTVGRHVRCGRCRHQWFQSPESAYAEGAAVLHATPRPATPPPAPPPQSAPLRAAAEMDAQAPETEADADADAGIVDHLAKTPAYRQDEPGRADGIRDFLPPPETDLPYDQRLLPALRRRQPASWWLRATALSMGAIAACLLMVLYAPAIAQRFPQSLPLLQLLGAAPADGLALADVNFKVVTENENYRRYVIGCAVTNESGATRALPDLRLQIYNRIGDAIVEERQLLAPIPVIGAGDEVPCDIPAPALRPGTAQTIVLDLGSPLDLWRRARLY